MPPSNSQEAQLHKLMHELQSLSRTVQSINAKVDKLQVSVRILSDILTEEVDASQQLLQQTNTATALLQSANNRKKKSMWPELVVPDVISSTYPTDKAPDHGQQTC